MKVFEVTLTRTTTVLMEATDAEEARECMKCRMGSEIMACSDYELTATETTVAPEDKGKVLRA